jgi:very-short-patch-repair endonuclease
VDRKLGKKSLAEESFFHAWQFYAKSRLKLIREHRFDQTRRWRFDFAITSKKVAVEIEGLGRHQTIAGFIADCEKYNRAAELGWVVLRFPARDLGKSEQWVRQTLAVLSRR